MRAYAGQDGAVLWTSLGAAGGDRFGWSTAGGAAALWVGAPRTDFAGPDSGSLYRLNLADGQANLRLDGQGPGEEYGFAVAEVGDLDGDSVPDLAIGAPGAGGGRVEVRRGSNLSLLHEEFGAGQDRLGASVCGLGDVDGDGRDDYAVGATQPGGSGYVRVLSGATHGALYQVAGNDVDDEFGYAVTGPGDLDGDGLADLVVGAPSDDPLLTGFRAGTLRVHVGMTGTFWREHIGVNDDALGTSVASLGDLDGDGYDEYFSGARHDDHDFHTGRVTVWSGATGSELFAVLGDADDNFFGSAVAAVPDLDGDGSMEFVVGAWRENTSAGSASGRVVLFAGDCEAPRRFCVAAPNSVGLGATIDATGPFDHDSNAVVLRVSGARPNQFGLFAYARSHDSPVPLGDGFLCLRAEPVGLFRLEPVPTDGAGAAQWALDLGAPPAVAGFGKIQPGATWAFQFWYRDPGVPGGSGFNMSDGVAITFCP